jgi:glycosyltransferase involved in cell wall biosynthesis
MSVNHEKSKFTFLMVSRLLRDKGVYEYVGAAQALKPKYHNVEFQLLGRLWDGSEITEAEVESWVKAGTISYFGMTDAIKDFYAASNCVVLPSYREGTANVLLEASSMERPLIASNVTGCRDIVSHGLNGFLCDARSVDSLTEQMEAMLSLSESQRVEMGRQGRERMRAKFEKRIVIERYFDEICALTQK